MNINAVRLVSLGVITGFVVMWRLTVVVFFGCVCINTTFLDCDSLPLVGSSLVIFHSKSILISLWAITGIVFMTDKLQQLLDWVLGNHSKLYAIFYLSIAVQGISVG